MAKGLPAGQAEFTVSAGAVQPRDPDAVAFFEMGYACAHRCHDAGSFVAGDEGQGWLDRPVAIGGVKVGVANSAVGNFDQHLAGSWIRNANLSHLERLTEPLDYGCFHHLRHDYLSLTTNNVELFLESPAIRSNRTG